MLNSPQLVDHSFFQPEPLLSWKGVSLGEGRSIFLDETGSTGSPAPDFSFARWVMGQSLPGLSADVQVIILRFQVQLSDRHGLHFQPAIFLLVLSLPLHGPFQQLQVKVLLTLP